MEENIRENNETATTELPATEAVTPEVETPEASEPKAVKKKSMLPYVLLSVFSTFIVILIVAAILLSTVFQPYGHYLSARWHLLWKNYEKAYTHLEKIEEPVLDSDELMLGFIIKPSKKTCFGEDGNAFYLLEYEYDKNGNLLMDGETYTDDSFKQKYEYDKNGNLIEKEFFFKGDKKSYSIKREYDKYNNVTSYKVVSGAFTRIKIDIDYTYKGKYPTSADMKIFSGSNNKEYSATLEFSHDKDGYLTKIVYKGDRTVLQHIESEVDCETVFSFKYDKDHFLSELNITEEYSYTIESIDKKINEKYEYREEYNKTDPVKYEWKDTRNGITTEGWKEWQYDKNGNCTLEKSHSNDGVSFTEFAYDENGFLIYKNENDNIEEYTNDEYGNPIDTKHTSAENGEVRHTKKKYEYDENGNIMKEVIEGETAGRAYKTVVEYEDWQIVYKPINKRNVFELYNLYGYINFLKF